MWNNREHTDTFASKFEYLFDRNYACSLSVFASEAPLLVNFARQVSSNSNENENKQRLQNDYVTHTLDTLGIKSDEPEGLSIISKYSETEEPLLLCILNSHRQFSSLKIDEIGEKCKVTKVLKNVRENATQTEREETREEKVASATKRLFKQKEIFDLELKEKEKKLREQAIIVDRQLSLLQKKLQEAQELMYNVQTKEKNFHQERGKEEQRIIQKDMELAMKEKLLSQEAIRLEKERDSYRKFETDLQKLRDELLKVKREFPTLNKNDYRDMHTQTDFESFTNLCRENEELNSLVKQQQARIEQLTLRAVRLSRQMEETQLVKRNILELPNPVIQLTKNSTIVSESSSTEDLIQDAKMRLKRLEEESTKADQYFFDYITSS
ncbi:golgin subfamily A member 6-like protein 2 isoform X2 [Leptopilina heterotoma]|uniref:golgin subfamily A member 6-like protein 2 isoform X2 n=1 Tax=Leptopilina heterotoma TaxID=63436 RepID=UPI001CA9828C|nr:golgin subfamily A member 6-like protein 2 isoform X2 [Leptopilina heterotoma]